MNTSKCNCNNCSAHLEFERERAGQTIECPKCGMETVLYVPGVKEPLVAPQTAKPVAKLAGVRWGSKTGWLVLCLVGLALVVEGFTIKAENVIEQLYAASQYCTGFLLLGLALVIERLR